MEIAEATKTPEQIAAIEAGLKADGVSTVKTVAIDYFGVDERHRVTLPDGVSWVEHKTLTEGERREFLKKVQKEVRLQRATGDAFMNMSQGEERKALLEVAITNWHLTRGGQEVQFSKAELNTFLTVGPPKIIDLIEEDVRRVNGWLQGDITVEDIDREIESLTKMRDEKIKENEGKASSSAR
jgi:hypothetical protein